MQELRQFFASLDAAIIARDYGTFCTLLSFPITYVRDDGTRVFHTPAELEPAFQRSSSALLENDHVALERELDDIESIGGAVVSLTFRTRLRHRDGHRTDPVTSVLILRLEGDVWRATAVINPISGQAWLMGQEQVQWFYG